MKKIFGLVVGISAMFAFSACSAEATSEESEDGEQASAASPGPIGTICYVCPPTGFETYVTGPYTYGNSTQKCRKSGAPVNTSDWKGALQVNCANGSAE